jgi:hypothetical protein
LKGSLDEK